MRTLPLPVMLIALALAVPTFLAPSVSAADSAGALPAVATGIGMGNMWLAVKIPAGAQQVVIDWLIRNATEAFFFAVADFYYDEQGALLGYGGIRAAPTDDAFVHVEGEDLPYVHEQLIHRGSGYGKGTTRIGCATCPPTTQTFTLVTVVTNASGPWNFTVRTADPVQLSVDSGDTARLYRSRDFSGDLNVQISPALLVRANLNTSITMTSKDTLVGWYDTMSSRPPPRQMSVDTPHGAVACPCEFYQHAAGPQAWGPGDYRFHLTGADADTEVLLLVASIRLPP